MTPSTSSKRRTIGLVLAIPALLCAVIGLLINVLLAQRPIRDFVEADRWQQLSPLPEVSGRLLFDHWSSGIWFEGVNGTYYQYQAAVNIGTSMPRQWVPTSSTGARLDRCDESTPPAPGAPPPFPIDDHVTCWTGMGDQMVPVTYALLQDGRVWRIIHPAPDDWASNRLISIMFGFVIGLCGGGLLLGVMWYRIQGKA
jgi:hypothetical protein